MVIATLVSAAFGANDPPSPGVLVDWVMDRNDPTPSPTATVTAVDTVLPPADNTVEPTEAEPTEEEPAVQPDTGDLSGFAFPIDGACLPESDSLMPNAVREYRNGVHEGMDFYDSDNCTAIGMSTEVLAAKAGTVIRAAHDYQPLTPDALAALEAIAEEVGWDNPDVLDVYRGRQVWIDHGNGVVTRYAHLNGIAEGIEVGDEVEQEQLIGYVGESGTPESVTDPGSEAHLHFEIRVGDHFLGQGLDAGTVRLLYGRAFTP